MESGTGESLVRKARRHPFRLNGKPAAAEAEPLLCPAGAGTEDAADDWPHRIGCAAVSHSIVQGTVIMVSVPVNEEVQVPVLPYSELPGKSQGLKIGYVRDEMLAASSADSRTVNAECVRKGIKVVFN